MFKNSEQNIEHMSVVIGQLWHKDNQIPPLPLFKDDLLQMFWTRQLPSLQRAEVKMITNNTAIVNKLQFEVLLFKENQRK
jgi:hypothetical protein